MEIPIVKVVSVADVVSANAASAILTLEVSEFLLEIRQEGKESIVAINKKQKVIQLQSSECLQVALERILGSLQNRFRKSKGGSARSKIKEEKNKDYPAGRRHCECCKCAATTNPDGGKEDQLTKST